jgi:NADH:ubiquinone oxidoreductase subunit 3 (subunit A)
MLAQYGHVLLFLFFGAGFAVVNILVASLLRAYSRDPKQKTIYECGMEPVGTPYVRTDIRFYLFGLLFLVFDVEALFLYPWAVIFRELGWTGFLEMLVFLGVLLVALMYAWRRGALRWEN